MTSDWLSNVPEFARRIRTHALRMTNKGGASHIGAIYSCADILATLYSGVLNVYPFAPRHPARDRFVLSKGHAGAGLYAALAERGFFPVELLSTHYQDGSELCGHVSHGLPGVEASTGSLGHGLPIACGMALAGQLKGSRHRVFCLMSDGECDEGSTWEAVLFAAHHRLSNLVAIVDCNGIQGLAPTSDILQLEPFVEKWKSFGWSTREIDGHNCEAVARELTAVPFVAERPSCLVARTVKGKGVSFMENTVLWHYRIPAGEEFNAAFSELEAPL